MRESFFGGVGRIIGFIIFAIGTWFFAIMYPELWLMCTIIIELVLLPVSLCVSVYAICLSIAEIYKAYRKFIKP